MNSNFDNKIYKNGVSAFISFTNYLLNIKRVNGDNRCYGALLSFYATGGRKFKYLKKIFDEVFNKSLYKAGRMMQWSDWLVDSFFPREIYNDCDCSLDKMFEDERLYHKPSFSFDNKDCYHSFYGRMSRKRKMFSQYGNFDNFMQLLLYRLSDDRLKKMPMYYIDIEKPDWVLEHIAKNPNQIKTGRTSVSCIMNMMFRWNIGYDCLQVSLIVRHNQWTHLWEEIFGSIEMVIAIENELKLKNKTIINVYFLSATLDEPTKAKQIINSFNVRMQNEK